MKVQKEIKDLDGKQTNNNNKNVNFKKNQSIKYGLLATMLIDFSIGNRENM